MPPHKTALASKAVSERPDGAMVSGLSKLKAISVNKIAEHVVAPAAAVTGEIPPNRLPKTAAPP